MAGFTAELADTAANPFGEGFVHFDTPPYTYRVKDNGNLVIKWDTTKQVFSPGAWTPPVVDDP